MSQKSNIKWIFSILLLLFLVPTLTVAHSPSGVSLDYDLDTDALDVIISHSVSDETTHYIKEVKVYLNDVLSITQPYTEQNTTQRLEVSFILAAEIGDTIKVTASCNLGGSDTGTITVQDPDATDPTDPGNGDGEPIESNFAYVFALLGLLGLSVITFIRFRK